MKLTTALNRRKVIIVYTTLTSRRERVAHSRRDEFGHYTPNFSNLVTNMISGNNDGHKAVVFEGTAKDNIKIIMKAAKEKLSSEEYTGFIHAIKYKSHFTIEGQTTLFASLIENFCSALMWNYQTAFTEFQKYGLKWKVAECA